MSLAPETRERIAQLVQSQPVFLFMKGQPEAPQCGFSAQVVQMLDQLVPGYGSFDVLSDPEIRDGIKEFSEWPTIPQLYVNGEFLGGCDIVREMYQSGELHQALGLDAPRAEPPRVTVTPRAVELLRAEQERRGGQPLHVRVDPRYQYGLGFGPVQDGELEVSADGLSLYFDRESAPRAEGMTIEVVDTAEGGRLAIDNPNAPRVGALAPGELKALLDAGRELVLVDVRTPEERATAAIPGARALDGALQAELEASPRDRTLVFHCHHGGRSQAAAEHFAALGFTDVHNLTGGIDAWSLEVDPSVPRY